MSSIVDLNVNNTSTNDKFRIPIFYNNSEADDYYGFYYCKTLKLTGSFVAKTREVMFKRCYESLALAMEDEENAPFNVDDIENSVEFVEIKCENDEESDYAYHMADSGKECEEIILALKE